MKDILGKEAHDGVEWSIAGVIAKHADLDESLYLPAFLGWDSSGKPVFWDMLNDPGLLVVGHDVMDASAALDFIVGSLLLQLSPLKLEMVVFPRAKTSDRGQSKLTQYAMDSLSPPKSSDVFRQVPVTIGWVKEELERRQELFAGLGAKSLIDYNKKVLESARSNGENEPPSLLPLLVVIAENFGELLGDHDAESLVVWLAAAKLKGICIVLAADVLETRNLSLLVQNAYQRLSVSIAASLEDVEDATGNHTPTIRGTLSSTTKREEHQQVVMPSVRTSDIDAVLKEIEPGCITIGEPGIKVKKQPWEDIDLTPDESLAILAGEMLNGQNSTSIASLKQMLRIGSTRAQKVMAILEKKHYVTRAKPGQKRKVLGPSERMKPKEECKR